jgi:hypothetical protein
MTLFSSTASPGQRWKIFLPGAASVQSPVLSMSAAAALIRNQWLSRQPPTGVVQVVGRQGRRHSSLDAATSKLP